MDYELYHDESLEGGYWHGMLLVPAPNKNEFADLLMTARINIHYLEKIGIKNVVRKGPIYNLASAWTQIGVAGLRSSAKGKSEPAFLGKQEKGKPVYEKINLHGMKFVLFRERDAHKHLTGFVDHASKIETTFRFGIKGGLHLLGSDENPIHITRIHFDGHQHHQRHLDKDRIVEKLVGLRKYCSISKRQDLIDDRHSDHKKRECQDNRLLQNVAGIQDQGNSRRISQTNKKPGGQISRRLFENEKEPMGEFVCDQSMLLGKRAVGI